jgi:hypothetical protein
MSTSQKPRAYKPVGYQKYTLGIWMRPPLHLHNAESPSLSSSPWIVLLSIRDIDWSLLRHGGMHWDTSNIDGLDGRQMTRGDVPSRLTDLFPSDGDLGREMSSFKDDDAVRHWTLREYPDRPAKDSRWTGEVALFAQGSDEKTMGAFRLGELKREMIRAAYVRDTNGRVVYAFEPETGVIRNDLPFGDLLGEGMRWMWPMESVIPVKGARKEPSETMRIANNDKGDERRVWLGCPDRHPSRRREPWMGEGWVEMVESVGSKNVVFFPRR